MRIESVSDAYRVSTQLIGHVSDMYRMRIEQKPQIPIIENFDDEDKSALMNT